VDDYELGKQLTITMIHQWVNDNLWTVIIMMIKCTVVRRGETKVSYYEEKGKPEEEVGRLTHTRGRPTMQNVRS